MAVETRKASKSGHASYLDEQGIQSEKERGITVVTENVDNDIKATLEGFVKEAQSGQPAH